MVASGRRVRARRTSDQDENVGIGEDFAPSSMIGRDIVDEYGGAIDAASRLSGGACRSVRDWTLAGPARSVAPARAFHSATVILPIMFG
jgi:hypothetical protein